MRKILVSIALVSSLSAIAEPPRLLAAEIEVIVHSETEMSSISRSELSKIFLKRLRTWSNGQLAVPVDQSPEREVRSGFTRRVHQQSVVTVEVYWKRMIFSGKRLPPTELANDQEVLDFVRSTPGAVGYVSATAKLDGVRTVTLTE